MPNAHACLVKRNLKLSSLHQELLKRVPNGHAARDRVSLRAKQKRDMELRAAKQAKETNKGMAGQSPCFVLFYLNN